MPWIKATPRMGGTFEFSMDDISRGKVYKTAEECMDSFSRFEKDASFGPLMTCRPIFFPLTTKNWKPSKQRLPLAKPVQRRSRKTPR